MDDFFHRLYILQIPRYPQNFSSRILYLVQFDLVIYVVKFVSVLLVKA